jgi:hypothetical protein
MSGASGVLPASGPVFLAWGREAPIDVVIEGQQPDRVANVLWYLPMGMHISGKTSFRGDLMTNTVVDSDAVMFGKDPFNFNFGRGSVTVAYRPIPFDGRFDASKVVLAFGFGGDPLAGGARAIKPIDGPAPDCATPPCDTGNLGGPIGEPPPNFDGIPEVDVFDRTGEGTWRRLPHLGQGTSWDLEDPASYVDPSTGTMLVRFVTDVEGVGFAFNVAMAGTIR